MIILHHLRGLQRSARAAGDRSRLSISISRVSATQRSPQPPSWSIRIAVRVEPAALSSDVAVHQLRPALAAPTSPRTRVVTRPTGVTLDVSSSCAPGDTFVVETGRLVSAPMVMSAEDCTRSRVIKTVDLFFKGQIGGMIANWRASRGKPFIDVQRSGVGVSFTGGVVYTYPVFPDSNNRWTQSVPADCVQVRIRAEGRAAFTIPPFTVGFDESVDIGRIQLGDAAIIRVRVVTPDEHLPVSQATAFLIPAHALDESVKALVNGDAPAYMSSGVTNDEGWARLADAQNGVYYLIVRAAHRTARVQGPIQLLGGQDVTLEPVELADVAIVHLSIGSANVTGYGPIDVWAIPRVAERWVPTAFVRRSGSAASPISATVPLLGRWRFEVYESSGSQLHFLGRKDIDIEPGAQSVEIDLNRFLFSGHVLLRGAGLKAALRFRAVQAESGAVPAAVSSDDNGSFVVPLSAPGHYNVSIMSADGTVATTVDGVEFLDAAIPVDVHVPSSRVTGVVRDTDGNAVSDARIEGKFVDWIEDGSGLLVVHADSRNDGRFVLDGLRAGFWEIIARTDNAASAPLTADVPANGDTAVTLRLQKTPNVNGWLVARDRPIPAADGLVFVVPDRVSELPGGISVRTDVQGHFQARLDRPLGQSSALLLTFFPALRPIVAVRSSVLEQPFNPITRLS
jgi:hypothetical protein